MTGGACNETFQIPLSVRIQEIDDDKRDDLRVREFGRSEEDRAGRSYTCSSPTEGEHEGGGADKPCVALTTFMAGTTQ